MQRWITLLNWVGVLLGAAVIAFGLIRFILDGLWTGLYIALAILLGGPVEDLLDEWVKNKWPSSADLRRLVDLATSAAFLICLGLAVYCM
jgi:hypothetical protein